MMSWLDLVIGLIGGFFAGLILGITWTTSHYEGDYTFMGVWRFFRGRFNLTIFALAVIIALMPVPAGLFYYNFSQRLEAQNDCTFDYLKNNYQVRHSHTEASRKLDGELEDIFLTVVELSKVEDEDETQDSPEEQVIQAKFDEELEEYVSAIREYERVVRTQPFQDPQTFCGRPFNE